MFILSQTRFIAASAALVGAPSETVFSKEGSGGLKCFFSGR
jgi:hypothetical protein